MASNLTVLPRMSTHDLGQSKLEKVQTVLQEAMDSHAEAVIVITLSSDDLMTVRHSEGQAAHCLWNLLRAQDVVRGLS